eukprot:4714314-Pleurochrysis_carterae.AAC.1
MACPSPVAHGATRARLDPGLVCASTPLPAVPSSPQPPTLPRRVAAAVPLAVTPPPIAEPF